LGNKGKKKGVRRRGRRVGKQRRGRKGIQAQHTGKVDRHSRNTVGT
jgi:hypothetical protein